MKILVVSPQLPYEQVPHAGGLFLLRHLEALSRDHDVTLVVPGSPEVDRHLHLAPEWLRVITTPFDLHQGPGVRGQWDRLRRRLRFRSLGTPALRGLRTAGLTQMASAADVVELQWIDTAILIRELRRARIEQPLVVVAHDITAEAVPHRQRRIGSRTERLLGLAWNPIRTRTERADLDAADLVMVFKDEDRATLGALGVHTPTMVLEPYLHLPTDSWTAGPDPSLLFTGAMWRLENQHGARWFIRSVWPVVRSAVPSATFTIVGAQPPAWLSALADASPGVVLTGTVEDLDPWYRGARAFVAPLFVPGGLKFKVPQAMAYGLPVVATPVAMQGLAAPPDAVWAVTDEPEVMAAALIDLFERPDAASEVGARARAWSQSRFSFAASTERVVAAYRQLVDQRTPGGPLQE